MPEGQPHIEAAAPVADAGGIYLPVEAGERLYQNELLEHVVEWGPAYDGTNRDTVVGAQPTAHSLALIFSQDCDLEQDYRQRRDDHWTQTDLRCVVLCPAFQAEDLRRRQQLTSRRWETVRQNKDERYAYLAEVPQGADGTGAGHAAILLDLVNYFTVPTGELYRQIRVDEAKTRCRLRTPWREHMQSRFAAYLARIGLPREHYVPESRRAALPAPQPR